MKILVVGSGGREDSICWKLSKSANVDKIYCAPGNAGTMRVAENINIKADDIDGLLEFAKENKIDLTVVGPEDPLVKGIVDKFKENNLKIFGVNKECAQLEGSKIYSKEFMERHGIKTAKYKIYNNFKDAKNDLDFYQYPIVIKADGLCQGKGVDICQSKEEAIKSLDNILNEKIFGDAGSEIIIEEFLTGIEASLLCFVSNGKLIPMESAKDYKKIYDNDKGPNTGGVGCYSPSPLFTEELKNKIRIEVLEKIELGFEKDGLDFNGILFIGFMIDKDINVLEFNVRFGDPETEVILPRLESDLAEIFLKNIDNKLTKEDLKWKEEKCMTVVLVSKGYPLKYDTGKEISLSTDKDTIVFHNGTKYIDGNLTTNGGRVLSVTRLGKSIEKVREEVYSEVEKINFSNMAYRKDIGIF